MATITKALTAAGVVRSVFYASIIAFLDLMLLVATVRLLYDRAWAAGAVAAGFTIGLGWRLRQQIRQVRRGIALARSDRTGEPGVPTA